MNKSKFVLSRSWKSSGKEKGNQELGTSNHDLHKQVLLIEETVSKNVCILCLLDIPEACDGYREEENAHLKTEDHQ